MKMINSLSSKDGSIKYIFQTNNGAFCEAIYYRICKKNGIPYDRYHICISSQAGCKMNCSFCATGRQGFCSNLSHKEMLSEIALVRSDIIKRGIELPQTKYSAVVMGMGEPLDNFTNLKHFCEQLNYNDQQLETIPISSVGIADKIPALAELQKRLKNIKFFVSLHSPYNVQRSQIMPINKKYNIKTLLQACKKYTDITDTKVTLSYMLIDNVNDSEKHMNDLITLIEPYYFKVQLLLYNETNNNMSRPSENKANVFQKALEDRGIQTIIRISKGQDIAGACGQLAAKARTK